MRPSHLLHLSSAGFHAIAQRDAEAWRWLAMLALMQNAVAFGMLDDLLIRDADRRCGAILLRLAGCRGPFAMNDPEDVFATQEQLAEMCNLSRTSLGEVLRGFEKRSLISRRYGRIVINRTLLTAMTDPD